MRRWLSGATALLMLTACAAPPAAPAAGQVRLAPELVMALPPPAELGRSLEATQLVTAHYGDRTFVFEGHLSATPERFLMVCLDAMGRKALTITWSASGIAAEAAPWVPAELRPDNMLADMVLLYWPEASVRRLLAASAGTLVTGPRRRSVWVDGKEIVQVDYATADPWTGSLSYRNLAWGYGLEIQSVEVFR